MRAKHFRQGSLISLLAALLIAGALVGALGVGPLARMNDIQAVLFCGGLALIYLKHPKQAGS